MHTREAVAAVSCCLLFVDSCSMSIVCCLDVLADVKSSKLSSIKSSVSNQSLTSLKSIFCSDNMPLILAVLTKAQGKSQIEETIFSNRFMAAPELNRMGAKIIIKKNKAIIIGQKKLNSADCISSDLRTTFSIILGAITAEGSSTISRIYHGLRGYYNLELKLKKLGIKIISKK